MKVSSSSGSMSPLMVMETVSLVSRGGEIHGAACGVVVGTVQGGEILGGEVDGGGDGDGFVQGDGEHREDGSAVALLNRDVVDGNLGGEVIAVEGGGPGGYGIEPVAEARGVGAAAGPGGGEAAVPVRFVGTAFGISTGELADDAPVFIEEGRAGGAALGGADVPVRDVNVIAVPGAGRAEITRGGAGIEVEADAFLGEGGMVDCHRHGGLAGGTIPAGVEDVVGGIDGVVELDEAEVGGNVFRAEDGAGVELGEGAVAGGSAGG